MASVSDVAAYILKTHGPMTSMKLQKLCYFAYGYHLVWDDEQLFPEFFEAWANGPVSPTLYGQHRGMFRLGDGDIAGDPARLTVSQRESVDVVVASFKDYTAHQLSEMSHQTNGPWDIARRRAGARDLERSNEKLLNDDIFEYFSSLISTGAED